LGGAEFKQPRETSWVWWLWVIAGGWIAGLIAWGILRDDAPVEARRLLIAGICSSIAVVVMVAALIGIVIVLGQSQG
jgi:hypothetical protein